jgi:hypothetical protein
MKIKLLIAEDKEIELEASIKRCKRISKEEGFLLETESIVTANSIEETIGHLSKVPFVFDIVILDIGFGDSDLDTEDLTKYLQADTLSESKVLIHTGNLKFQTNSQKLLNAISNGVKGIAIKGVDSGPNSFQSEFKRILRDIKYETIWSNIGRFTPQWKRDLFRNDELWRDLKIGKKTEKIFILLDISNSTQFVIAQRKAAINDKHTFELFRNFANLATQIIEENAYQGIVERYSGDEILAYFDPTNKHEERFVNIIECAKKIRKKFNSTINDLYNKYNFSQIRSGQNVINPELRILIGFGDVMWVLQGADSRPQLSIMTDKVAKFYRSFTDRDKNYNRVIQPNNIYITHDIYIEAKDLIEIADMVKLDLRDFGNEIIYNLK